MLHGICRVRRNEAVKPPRSGKMFHGLNESGGSLVVEMAGAGDCSWAAASASSRFCISFTDTRNRSRFLKIGFGLLQRGLKLRQCRRQGSGLHHDFGGGEPLRIDLGQNCIVDRSRGERRVARRQRGQVAVSRAGMKIPAGVFLDAIDDVLLVHDQIVIRIGVASDVVGVEDFGITNAVGVRRWRLLWPQRQLRAWWNTRRETTVE